MNPFFATFRFAFVAACCVFAGPGQAAAAKKPDASANFFTNGRIPHIQIEIAKTNLDILRRGDGEKTYVRATVREGTNVWEEVGIHIKGAAGSKRAIDSGEPALTLNFDKFRDGQKFHGLDKLHLNNSVQDASLLCEAICARLFLDAGVPTARSTHARVTLNGRDLGPRGLYVLKEGYDKTFLRHHFKNATGNLYDGGFIREITDPLQISSGTGDVKKYADLKALAAAAQDASPTNRFARMEKLLELDRFIDFVALEVMTWHWDGYAMKRNNYRVYHDPSTDKITFFPHGMDQMFWQADGLIQPPNIEGLIARALLQTPEGRLRYRQRMTALLTNVFTAEKLTNHIALLQSRLQPALETINKDKAREQAGAAANLRNAILSRIKFLNRRLSEPEPKPLVFDAGGFAALTKWEIPDSFNPATTAPEKIVAKLDTAVESDGRKTLHITALPGLRSVGSWRSRVMLAPGTYVLEGRVRTAGVTVLTNDVTPPKGLGAGLRQSRATEPRKNQLLGDNGWVKLEHEFTVTAGPDEVPLVCELRAGAGEAWFDLDSLKLRKK